MKPQQKVFAKIWLGSLSVALGSAPALAQPTQPDWNAPFPAHRIIDNVYFVGTQLLGSFLVTTPEGHTRGCTSWGLEVQEQGQAYNALIVCSFGVNDNYVLVDNPDYPEIADDWAAI